MSNNLGGWNMHEVLWPGSGKKEYHVVPVNDLREHEFDGCWCRPDVDPEEPNCVVHNSMDQRERYEEGKLS